MQTIRHPIAELHLAAIASSVLTQATVSANPIEPYINSPSPIFSDEVQSQHQVNSRTIFLCAWSAGGVSG